MLILGLISLAVCHPAGAAEPVPDRDHALTLYTGRMTDETWFESLSANVGLVDARIVVVALARTFARSRDGALTFEVEGQVGRYTGKQDNFEFNLPVAGRWHRFPWKETVRTSLAFGLGPSWATREPEVEKRINGRTERFLVHWFLELTLGPPGGSWDAVIRLHHRSTGFGVVAEDGGSNTLAAGLKFGF